MILPKRVVIASALLLASAVALVFGLPHSRRSLRSLLSSQVYYSYVCTRCGQQKNVKLSRIGFVSYATQTTFHSTAVSLALGTNYCSHDWLLFSSAKVDPGSGSLIAISPENAPPSPLHSLLGNDVFASDLAKMQNPSAKWHTLVTAISTNREIAESLSQWSHELPYRNFGSWWNKSQLAEERSPK